MFTKNDQAILTNYAKINKNILFEKGKKIKTISLDESVYSEADLSFGFSQESGIYDLQKFLSALNLIGLNEDLSMEYDDDQSSIVLKNKEKTFFYRCSEKALLKLPEGHLDPVEEGVSFDFSAESLNYILSGCNKFGLEDIVFLVEEGNLYVSGISSDESSQNEVRCKLLENCSEEFRDSLKYSNFNIANDNYKCVVVPDSDGSILYMKGEELGIQYWIQCG